jgi:hypothetical protein
MKLLRIEAINLAYSIEDTEDLKTRRGGSYILLDAIQKIATKFQKEIEAISTGASAGLFSVLADDHEDIAKRVRQFLESATPECFVVSVIADSGSFSLINEKLIASNRWQQMQRLSFSGTGLEQGQTVCDVDEIRPTHEAKQSASVAKRRDAGLQLRQNIYQRVIGHDWGHFDRFRFSNSFGEIARNLPRGVSPETLDGKLAVFYADGNKFGRFGKNALSPEAAREWDKQIKQRRRQFISDLMIKTANHPSWNMEEGSTTQLRMEVLLWGGDELMIAVPGWCGLELAQHFFTAMRDWQYPVNSKPEMLYHAASLVICHHQAPISALSSLVRRLADIGKGNTEMDSLTWLTLESFDHTGDSLDDYLSRRYPNGFVNWPHVQLNPNSVAILLDKLPKLKEVLPKSQLHRVARELNLRAANEPTGDQESRCYEFIAKNLKDAQRQTEFNDLWKAIATQTAIADWNASTPVPVKEHLPVWIILLELWDYCIGETNGVTQ